MISFNATHPILNNMELFINYSQRLACRVCKRSLEVTIYLDEKNESCPETLKEISRIGRVSLENICTELAREKETFNREISEQYFSSESLNSTLSRLSYLIICIVRSISATEIKNREKTNNIDRADVCGFQESATMLSREIKKLQNITSNLALTPQEVREMFLRNHLDWIKNKIALLKHNLNCVVPNPIREEELQKIRQSKDELKQLLEENFPAKVANFS